MRGLGASLCMALLVIALGAGAARASSTAPLIVSASVPTATELTATNCATGQAGRTVLSGMPGDSLVTTQDCEIEFGSGDDTAALRIYQRDAGGVAMRDTNDGNVVGYWPMNGNLSDLSPTENAGSLDASPAAPTYVAGDPRFGQALAFDGGDHASIPYNAAYNTTTFTVDIWFRTTSIANAQFPQLVNKGTDVSSDHQFEMAFLRDTNEFVTCVSVAGADTCLSRTATGLVDGQWHHAALTVDDATKAMRLYLDGVLAASRTNAASVNVQVAPIDIGRTPSSAAYAFLGEIDEFRFAKVARSAEEVRTMYLGAISDYSSLGGAGDRDWSSSTTTTNMFGACLRSTENGAITDGSTWTPDASTIVDEPAVNADCGDGDADPWRPILTAGGAVGSTVARSPSGTDTARVNLRFGVRTLVSQAPGTYGAELVLEVVAPAV